MAGNEIASFDEYKVGTYTLWMYSAVFNPDGDAILAASGNGAVKLWDLAGNEIASFDEYKDTLWGYSAVFNPDGDVILTTSWYGTTKLWNLAGNEIASLDGHTDGVNTAVFSPAGDTVLTANKDGTATLWDIYPTMQSRVAVAQERLSRGFTDAECIRFFSDDRNSCPQTVEAVFALFDDNLATP